MVERGRRILGICLALAALLAACGGARRGKLIDHGSLPESSAIRGRALTSEGSPVVIGPEGGLGYPTKGGAIHYGPWVVQRQGQKALLLANRWIGGTGRRVRAPPDRRCPLRARRGQYPGYRIEWTGKDGPEAYQQLCGGPVLPLVLVSAVLRGEGSKRIGEALPDELGPHIAPIVEVNNWGTGCDGSVSVSLPGDTDVCPLDPVIETIGKFLRERDASDRIVVRMGLRSAPAL